MINLFLSLLLSFNSAQQPATKPAEDLPKSFKIELCNPLNKARKDVAVVLTISEIKKKFKDFNSSGFAVFSDGKEIASQADDLNMDGTADEICFVADIEASKTKTIEVKYNPTKNIEHNYTKRTQAELSHKFGGTFENRKYIGGTFKNVDYMKVPAEHTDHSYYIRYEGPGWESDKVAYRFYLDWRNAFDVFGKKVNTMVLQNVGQDGFDSYHEASDWGQDVFKAGKALGIGSFGILNNTAIEHTSVVDSLDCRIVLNGAVRSLIRTNYKGWKVGTEKYNVTSEISIFAGSRITNVELTFDKAPKNLVAGIIKDETAPLVKDSVSNYNAFGIYQKCLAKDNLGLALIVPKNDCEKFSKADLDYVYIFKSGKTKITYSFFATWEQEKDGIKNQKEFSDEIHTVLLEMNSPVKIKIKK